MVNFDTVLFIEFLNDLAIRTGDGGIKPLSQAKRSDCMSTVFYDESTEYDAEKDKTGWRSAKYKVVEQASVIDVTDEDLQLYDDVLYIDAKSRSFLKGCSVYAVVQQANGVVAHTIYVNVDNGNILIAVENGAWYVC